MQLLCGMDIGIPGMERELHFDGQRQEKTTRAAASLYQLLQIVELQIYHLC